MSVLMKNEQMLAGLVPSEESVSVTADGSKTYSTLFNELWALIDTNKVGAEAKLQIGGDWFSLIYCNQSIVIFVQPYFDTSNGKSKSLQIAIGTASTYYEQNGDSQTPTNLSSNVPTSGEKITLYY